MGPGCNESNKGRTNNTCGGEREKEKEKPHTSVYGLSQVTVSPFFLCSREVQYSYLILSYRPPR
jgi:hypothetical protein